MRKKNENGRHETGVADVVEVLIANTLALMVRQWARKHPGNIFLLCFRGGHQQPHLDPPGWSFSDRNEALASWRQRHAGPA